MSCSRLLFIGQKIVGLADALLYDVVGKAPLQSKPNEVLAQSVVIVVFGSELFLLRLDERSELTGIVFVGNLCESLAGNDSGYD